MGPEIYRVAFKVEGHITGGYRIQDGDAAFLDPGTPIYAVKGYAPEFRLASVSAGWLTLYEANTNPGAKVGAELLDIGGKVSSIGIRGGWVDDPGTVQALVEMVLEAPVDQSRRDREVEMFLIPFNLEDGTTVVRGFRAKSGELSRGIMTPASFGILIAQARAGVGTLRLTAPPTMTPTPTPMPPIPTVERDSHGEPPMGPGAEVGTGYPYTLMVHCGIREVTFDGRRWMADPILSDGAGNPPTDWARNEGTGVIVLVSDDLARFTSKTGGVIEFVPWPSDTPWIPCA